MFFSNSVCPRCGKRTMTSPVFTNALSRIANVYVCSICGNLEAARKGLRKIINERGIENANRTGNYDC